MSTPENVEPAVIPKSPSPSVDRKRLGVLDKEFRMLTVRLDATRRSLFRILSELSDPRTGEKVSKDDRSRLEGIDDPDMFFHELARYADLRSMLDGDFGALTRYRALRREIIDMQQRVSTQVEEQEVEMQVLPQTEPIVTVEDRAEDVARFITPEPPPLPSEKPRDPSKTYIAATRTDANLSRLNFIPRSTGDLRRALRKVKKRLIPRLPELLGKKNHKRIGELSRMTHPVEFLQALEAERIYIKDLMTADHYACLAEFERRMLAKSAQAEERRREREARRAEKKIAQTAQKVDPSPEEADGASDVIRLKNKSISDSIRLMRIALTPRLPQLVGEKTGELKRIEHSVDFLRALVEAGVDLEKELGERRVAIFTEHERRLKLKEARKAAKAYGSLDEQIDRITVDARAEEKALARQGEIEPAFESPRVKTEHERFRAFYAKAREVATFTPKEEYDIFASYVKKKEGILQCILGESEVMKRAAVLFIQLRHLDPAVHGVRKSLFGYQFFQGYSIKETSDVFGVLDGDELIKRLLALADTKDGDEDDGEEIEFADDEESDDDFIDFNLSKSEICRLVRQQAKSYFQHFERMEKLLKRRGGKNFASLQKEILEKEKETPVETAMRIFQSNPSTPSLVRAVESLWVNARASENSSEIVYGYLEDFFAELRALGIRFSVKHLPKTVSSVLQGMEVSKKEMVPLIMRLGPSPALIRALGAFSMQAEIAPSVQGLLSTQQRILAPHIRNVCFATLFRMRNGELPDECVQYGTLGLLRATDTFDHRSGVRFYEYCWPPITEAIARGLYENQGKIRVPIHHKGDIAKVRKAMQFSETIFGDQSDEHIAEAMKKYMHVKIPLTAEAVRDVREIIRLNETVSLETPSYEGGQALQDKLVTADMENAEEIVTEVIKATSLQSLEVFMKKAGLTRMEQKATRRFLEEQTLQDIADTNLHSTFGYEQRYSRERIRQYGAKGLGKLRRYFKRHDIGENDLF